MFFNVTCNFQFSLKCIITFWFQLLLLNLIIIVAPFHWSWELSYANQASLFSYSNYILLIIYCWAIKTSRSAYRKIEDFLCLLFFGASVEFSSVKARAPPRCPEAKKNEITKQSKLCKWWKEKKNDSFRLWQLYCTNGTTNPCLKIRGVVFCSLSEKSKRTWRCFRVWMIERWGKSDHSQSYLWIGNKWKPMECVDNILLKAISTIAPVLIRPIGGCLYNCQRKYSIFLNLTHRPCLYYQLFSCCCRSTVTR